MDKEKEIPVIIYDNYGETWNRPSWGIPCGIIGATVFCASVFCLVLHFFG